MHRTRRMNAKQWARLRSATGILLLIFILTHLINHGLGLISMDAMESGRRVFAAVWRHPIGQLALYGSLLLHLFIALRSLSQRRSLRLPPWEWAQLGLGLLIPILLIDHVAGTVVNRHINGIETHYPLVIALIGSSPWQSVKQVLLLLAVWLHLSIGMHYWLRIKRGYAVALPWLYALAILIPVLALIGILRALADQHDAIHRDPALGIDILREWRALSEPQRARVTHTADMLLTAYLAAITLTMLVRVWRNRRTGGAGIRIEHPSRPIQARAGQTILEALRAARVPHAAVCGGRARCTTCRVRIGAGLDALAAPNDLETTALTRIGAPVAVRLACQTTVTHPIHITPLVDAANTPHRHTPNGVFGAERPVVAMFVDLRDSTALGEIRLPFDTVFILNQFFDAMSAALQATDGHYAQFSGDGLLALYGLNTNLTTACRNALAGADQMERRLAALNQSLATELPQPLRMGIGLHCGEAIVGTMGPPNAPNLTAVGDNINIAARLEGLSKTYDCTLVVSTDVLTQAGWVTDTLPTAMAAVRGRQSMVKIHPLPSLSALDTHRHVAHGGVTATT